MAKKLDRASELRSQYGNTINASQVREYCAAKGLTYPTLAKQLRQYKVGDQRGVWNLTVREALEKTLTKTPATVEKVSQNLVPVKDDSFVSFLTLRRLLGLRYSILYS